MGYLMLQELAIKLINWIFNTFTGFGLAALIFGFFFYYIQYRDVVGGILVGIVASLMCIIGYYYAFHDYD